MVMKMWARTMPLSRHPSSYHEQDHPTRLAASLLPSDSGTAGTPPTMQLGGIERFTSAAAPTIVLGPRSTPSKTVALAQIQQLD